MAIVFIATSIVVPLFFAKTLKPLNESGGSIIMFDTGPKGKVVKPDNISNSYSSIEEAIKEYCSNESWMGKEKVIGVPQTNDPLMLLETEDKIMLLLAWEQVSTINKPIPTIYTFIFGKKDEGVSYPVYCYTSPITTDIFVTYSYQETDRVVRDVLRCYARSYASAEFNDDNTLYHGAGTQEEIKNLTILGEKPTEVIPFVYKEETYYFWYYLGKTEFDATISENIDMNAFVMADVIDILQIKI